MRAMRSSQGVVGGATGDHRYPFELDELKGQLGQMHGPGRPRAIGVSRLSGKSVHEVSDGGMTLWVISEDGDTGSACYPPQATPRCRYQGVSDH
jgi:hypothetical protein